MKKPLIFLLGYFEPETPTGGNVYFKTMMSLLSEDFEIRCFSAAHLGQNSKPKMFRRFFSFLYLQSKLLTGSRDSIYYTDFLPLFSFGRKLFIHLHDVRESVGHRRHGRLAFLLKGQFLKGRLRIVTISKFSAAEIEALYNTKPPAVIYPIVPAMEHLDSECPRDIDFLFVGQFDQRKKQSYFLEALREFDSSVKAVFIGIDGGQLGAFRQTLSNWKTDGSAKINICIGVSDAEKVQMLGRAKFLVLLSSYEGFGIPVIEGVRKGCIPLLSDFGPCQDFDFSFFTVTLRNSRIAGMQLRHYLTSYGLISPNRELSMFQASEVRKEAIKVLNS